MNQYVYICNKCHMHSHTLYPAKACRYCHGKHSLQLIGEFDDQDEGQRKDMETRLDAALREHNVKL